MFNAIKIFGNWQEINEILAIVLIVLIMAIIFGLIFVEILFLVLNKKEEEEEDIKEEEGEVEEKEEILKEDEESYKAGIVVYDRSFEARYIQLSDESKRRYILIKNEIMSYDKVRSRRSWKRETYKNGRKVLAKLSIRGKTICLYLPLNAEDYTESKYKVQDVHDTKAYKDTGLMYRIINERRMKYAIELIKEVMNKNGLKKGETQNIDYYEPYEGIVELIEKGLIKRNVRKVKEEIK